MRFKVYLERFNLCIPFFKPTPAHYPVFRLLLPAFMTIIIKT